MISNPDLYRKIHPADHSYDRRLQALYDLKEIGYQAGTGAMIGMPFQTAEDLADDLLFYKQFDAPMVGMGPYNPHPETPLTLAGAPYPGAERRFALGLKMIALLRLLRDGPSDELNSQKIVIGYGRWGDSKHFRQK